jgi:hypothetical protein
MTLEFSRQIKKKPQISYLTKIRLVDTELFHADQQTHNEANSLFFNFANAPKSVHIRLRRILSVG